MYTVPYACYTDLDTGFLRGSCRAKALGRGMRALCKWSADNPTRRQAWMNSKLKKGFRGLGFRVAEESIPTQASLDEFAMRVPCKLDSTAVAQLASGP